MSCGVIGGHWCPLVAVAWQAWPERWFTLRTQLPDGALLSLNCSGVWCAQCTVHSAHVHMCTCAMFTVPFVQYIIVSTLLLCEAEIFVHCAETRRGLQLFSSFTGILEKLQLSTALQCKILKLQNTWMERERVQANVTSANRVFKRQWKSAPRQHMGPLWELNGSMEQAHIVNWGTACAGTSPPTK